MTFDAFDPPQLRCSKDCSNAGVRLKGAAFDGARTVTYSTTEPMIETVMLSECVSGADLIEWRPGAVCIAEPPPEFVHDVGAVHQLHLHMPQTPLSLLLAQGVTSDTSNLDLGARTG